MPAYGELGVYNLKSCDDCGSLSTLPRLKFHIFDTVRGFAAKLGACGKFRAFPWLSDFFDFLIFSSPQNLHRKPLTFTSPVRGGR